MPVIWLVLVRSVAADIMGAAGCSAAAALILFMRSRRESIREGDGMPSCTGILTDCWSCEWLLAMEAACAMG